jgi:hypothetical protein
MKIPPPIFFSRSFVRFTMRVALPHLGQSVLLVVSIIFLRSAVLAIFAMRNSPISCGSADSKAGALKMCGGRGGFQTGLDREEIQRRAAY